MDSTQIRAAAGSTPALALGIFFAMRIAVTLVCTRWLGFDPQTSAAIELSLGFLLGALLCFHSLGRSFSWQAELNSPPVRWVLAYLAFALLSFLWSGAVSPGSSFAYWLALGGDVGIAVLLLGGPDPSTRIRALLRGYIAGACILALLAWVMPTQQDLRLGDMDYLNTNQIGNLCAFAFFFAQYLERKDGDRWRIVKLLLLATVVRSLSKTTIVALVVSQSFLFFRDETASRMHKVKIVSGILLAGALFSGLFMNYLDIYTTTGNQAETLTGRTAIWAFALDAGLSRPLLGNGFDALWHVMPPFGPDRFEARHAENELLQQFFAYGVAGVVLIAGIYGSIFLQIRRMQDRSVRLLLYSLLIYTAVRGLAEAEPFDLLLPLWTIVLLNKISAGEAQKEHQRMPSKAQRLQQGIATESFAGLKSAPVE